MNIQFADSFRKSLKTIRTQNTWWYKTYKLFNKELPIFFKNIWFFRKQLWSFRGWDYSYNLDLFSKSLEKTAHYLEFYGYEIEETKSKKVEKIKRVIHLINNLTNDTYIESAEKELGELIMNGIEFEPLPDRPELYEIVDNDTEEEKEHNKKVFNRATEIENEEWNEIWEILKGQNHSEYVSLYESQSKEKKMERDLWKDWFDGSGMKHWWD